MFRYYSPSHCLGSKMDELKILYGDFNLDTLVTVLRRPANRPDAQLLESATVV